jgi:hypothetical protein
MSFFKKPTTLEAFTGKDFSDAAPLLQRVYKGFYKKTRARENGRC